MKKERGRNRSAHHIKTYLWRGEQEGRKDGRKKEGRNYSLLARTEVVWKKKEMMAGTAVPMMRTEATRPPQLKMKM